MEEASTSKKSVGAGRMKSIDAFRGFALALMLLGDNPGNPDRVYPQLVHAAWDGWTIKDLAFPFFIIIMGMVVPYVMKRKIIKGNSPLSILSHVFLRSIGIFALGLLLNGFPIYDLTSIRILGVLQRIAICYFVVSVITLILIYLVENNLTQTLVLFILSIVIITVYYLLMKNVTVPGVGKGILKPEGNLVQYIDLRFLKGHLYRPNWDPEGILSTLPAIASALFGAVAGQILIHDNFKKIFRIILLFILGIVILKFSYIVNRGFPFNKNLWSSSFVMLTTGYAYIAIAALYFIIDVIKYDSLFKPLIALGSSSIFVYVISEFIQKTVWKIPVTDVVINKTLNLNVWITTKYISPWAGDKLDSLYFSVAYTILWIGIMSIVYHEKTKARNIKDFCYEKKEAV